MAGQPMDLKFEKIQRKMPLSQQFPGAHLTGWWNQIFLAIGFGPWIPLITGTNPDTYILLQNCESAFKLTAGSGFDP